VLSKIMSAAVSDGYLARSPCTGVRLPAEVRKEMRHLTAADLNDLADAIDHHYHPLVLTAAYSGLRWGELAGLRPTRVDPLRRTIQVVEQLTDVGGVLSFGPPKTAAGRRSVAIPRFLAELLAEQNGDRRKPGSRPRLSDAGRQAVTQIELHPAHMAARRRRGRTQRLPVS
jgi:integrase